MYYIVRPKSPNFTIHSLVSNHDILCHMSVNAPALITIQQHEIKYKVQETVGTVIDGKTVCHLDSNPTPKTIYNLTQTNGH